MNDIFTYAADLELLNEELDESFPVLKTLESCDEEGPSLRFFVSILAMINVNKHFNYLVF